MERKPIFDWHPSPRRPRCPSSVSSSSAFSSRLPSFSSDAGDSFVSAQDYFEEDEPESSVSSKETIAGGYGWHAALQFVVPTSRYAWWRWRRKPLYHLPIVPEEYRLETHSGVLIRFSLRELQVATNNFSRKNELGIGYFGIVYKGQLADGSLVAVNRLKDPHRGTEPQFEKELISLKHKNVLILQGFCMTPTERLIVYPYMANRSRAHQLRAEEDPEVHLGQLKMFSLRELQVATDSFSNKNILGRGGFGKVYKGRLADGSLVAVKRLNEECTPGGELQFLTEIEMINNAVHRNLLTLRGFCMTPTELLLVYPYMANGTVASRLRGRLPTEPPLDWPTRRQIALGSARGLSYLHDHCDPKIIHRDVKPANILLDEEFEAALGDFGLAILIDCKDTHVTPDSLCGTFGYIAPEYVSTGKCSEKTDVFGYGIMLLELITGKRAIDLARLANDGVMMLDWVKGLLEEERLDTLVDPELHGNYMEAEVKFAVQLAILCSQVSPMGRPKMSEVVRILEGEDLTERWEKWKNRERWEKWKNRERWEKWKKENKRWEEWEDWEEWKNTETWEEWEDREEWKNTERWEEWEEWREERKNTERWEEWKKEKERWEEWKNTERWEEWEEWREEWKNTERWEEWMNTEIWEEWKKEKERWEEWKKTERWEEWEEWKNTEIWEEWKKENERWEKWKNSERWEEWKKENERWEEWKKENERWQEWKNTERWEEWKKENERWEEWRGEWKKKNGRWEERKENECRLDPELGTYPRWIDF